MMPAIALQGLVTLAGASLQVYRRFARPALATAVYNVTFAATLWLLPVSWPPRRAAWSVILATGAALFFLAALLWKHRPASASDQAPTARRDASLGRDVRHMVRFAGPMAAGYAVHHAILLVDRAMATTLDAGRAASLQYAYHLALTIGQVSGLAVSTALFPRLAEQSARDDHGGLRAALGDSLRFVLLLGLPAACALVLLRAPVVELLLRRGAFGSEATLPVSQALIWYTVAVLADAFCQPLWRIVYAQHRPWTVLAVNGAQTAVRLLGNFALLAPLGHRGLAISAAIGLALQAGLLSWWSWRRVGSYLTPMWWRDAGRIVLATSAASATLALGLQGLDAVPPIVALVAGGSVATLVYLIALRTLGLRAIFRTPALSSTHKTT
jgi:putative peptidoglycan lipid II flippase